MAHMHKNSVLAFLMLSAVPTVSVAGDHSFSCVTNDKPFNKQYELLEDGELKVRNFSENNQGQAEGQTVKYKTLRRIDILQEKATCVTKNGRSSPLSYSNTYLIELETEDYDQQAANAKVTLMFLCRDDGGASDGDCTHSTIKKKLLRPTYRYQVIIK